MTGSFGSLAENILASHEDYWSNEEICMLAFIIDDGVASRGHRTNFFSDNTHIGIGIYPFMDGGKRRDMLTMLYSGSAGTCPTCASFPQNVND
jgi:uncharacterized protein YkwD